MSDSCGDFDSREITVTAVDGDADAEGESDIEGDTLCDAD
jgi:hypothetical protein